MSLVPVPSEQTEATCANCGAALLADQRYCLACGQPCSPVRLAFLDVLQSEKQPQAGAGSFAAPIAYTPLLEPSGAPGWLRRYSPLFGVLSVLLLAMIIGLLVGHWVTQDKAPGRQVVEVKGLTGAPAAAASTSPTSTAASAAPASVTSKPHAKAEAEAAKAEAKETPAEKAPPPKPVKVAPTKLTKLSHTTGKKHAEEVNSLGAQPIETGG